MQKIEDDIRKAREHKKHFESKLREHRADIAKKQEIVEQLKKSIEVRTFLIITLINVCTVFKASCV